MQKHNDDTIKTSDTVPYKNIPLTLFERVRKGYLRFYCERELETEENCNIWTALLWPQQHFFPVLLGSSTGDLGAQPLWDMFLIPASLQLVWSPTDWTSFAPSYIIIWRPLFLWASQFRTHSTRPRSRLYPDIPRPDAPVIYRCISYFDCLAGVNMLHLYIYIYNENFRKTIHQMFIHPYI